MINVETILRIMPRCPKPWAEAIITVTPDFDITDEMRMAAFLAQIAHESSEVTRVEENLNYSASRLLVVFPKYFPKLEDALPFDRKPEKIANYVYANRMGNGGPETGDGWKHRGVGPIQLTGKENHEKCGKDIGRDLLNTPELLTTPIPGIESSCWFWKQRGLNTLADIGDFKTITKRINGGYIGLEEREKYYGKAKNILGVS